MGDQELVVYKRPVPLGNETTVPTTEDVDHLFATLPGLKTLSIGAKEGTTLFHFDMNGGVRALETRVNNREKIAPVLLKGLGSSCQPSPHYLEPLRYRHRRRHSRRNPPHAQQAADPTRGALAD